MIRSVAANPSGATAELGLLHPPQNQLIPYSRVHFDASGLASIAFDVSNDLASVGT